jgi:hypothetical protein
LSARISAFVSPRQPGVADDVGSEDRYQLLCISYYDFRILPFCVVSHSFLVLSKVEY